MLHLFFFLFDVYETNVLCLEMVWFFNSARIYMREVCRNWLSESLFLFSRVYMYLAKYRSYSCSYFLYGTSTLPNQKTITWIFCATNYIMNIACTLSVSIHNYEPTLHVHDFNNSCQTLFARTFLAQKWFLSRAKFICAAPQTQNEKNLQLFICEYYDLLMVRQ